MPECFPADSERDARRFGRSPDVLLLDFLLVVTRLLATADGGGSNVYRVRLWKTELQKLANELGFPVTVCHLPPGTSKWNKIEHRLFSFITINWRAKPLRSFRTVVQLIAATTTKAGLTVPR